MENTITLDEAVITLVETDKKQSASRLPFSGTHLILLGIAGSCVLLFVLGFPLFAIFVFGFGMCFTLMILYLIKGFTIELELDEKEVEEAIRQDLFS